MQLEVDAVEMLYYTTQIRDPQLVNEFFEKAKARAKEAAPLNPCTTAAIAGDSRRLSST